MKNEKPLGADAAAVADACSKAADQLSHAARQLERDRSEVLGFTHRGFKEATVNQVIDNLIESVRKHAIATILERATRETTTVKPGMWFSAGYLRHELIENRFRREIGSGNPVSMEQADATRRSNAP